ncbi:MAG: DUF6056 family protein [Clostridiales bacterium]|nr:DUF6056 family protein [Clostridiales bacterium]
MLENKRNTRQTGNIAREGRNFSGNWEKFLPFGVVCLVTILWHAVLKISAGDDVVYFQTLMDERSIWEILAHRYATWSSRMAIEFVLIPLVNYPLLWKVIDILVFTGIPVLLYRILQQEGDSEEENRILSFLISGFTLLYPFSDMVSAGWIATTTNYLWPLFCLLFLAFLAKKLVCGKRILWYEAAAGILFCIYGSSQEQVAAILLVLLVLTMIYFGRRKQWKQPLLFVFTVIDVISLITILRCPGNAIRSAQEIEGRMPQFANFSVWEKIYMGAANVERIFIAQVNSIFFIVTVILAALVYRKTRNYLKTVGAAVPVLVLFGYSVIRTGHPWYEKIFIVPKQEADWNYSSMETWLPILFLMVTAAGMLYGLFCLLRQQLEIYIDTVLLLGVGLASGIVMGFSPTIYASADRPYIYLYFILIFVCLFLLKREGKEGLPEKNKVASKLAVTLFLVFILVNVAEVFWMCHIM